VSVVAPFRYTRLVFGIAIGVAVFAEVPDMLTLLGAAVIIGSGLYSFARERARTAASLRRNAA
jgi:drug/metabolite transporter (DMT)-like permease